MNRKTSQGETPVFVNLLSDAGFKAVYADPANKSLLISLLNAVLPDDVRVSDIIEYRDREQPPETVYSKKTILDLVCRDAEGNILGVEVQKKVDSRLFSRCVYYAAGQYHSQLLAGGDYASLHPVFEIAFLAQNYPHESPELWDADHIVSHYTFTEKRTGECPYSTIFIILAEIGRFDKSAEECVTARDRLFYWFRHAAEFTTVAIAHNMKKMISVMYAERAKAVATDGRATRGTEAGAEIRGWRQPDVMEEARSDGGSQTSWRQPDVIEAARRDGGNQK